MFKHITLWEQQQILDAYPQMKGHELCFWKNYIHLEKRFRISYLLGGGLFLLSMLLLYLVS